MQSHRISIALVMVGVLFAPLGCAVTGNESQVTAQRFIDDYTAEYVSLSYTESKAQWALNTRIVEGDSTNADHARVAGEATAAFTGSIENIETCRRLLKSRLSPRPQHERG